jgi:hypothetical protein
MAMNACFVAFQMALISGSRFRTTYLENERYDGSVNLLSSGQLYMYFLKTQG